MTVLVLLFIEKLKKTRSREGTEEDFTKLYRQAEMLWIRHVQQEILKSDKYPQKKVIIRTLSKRRRDTMMSRKNWHVFSTVRYTISDAVAEKSLFH